jgi:Coenzyme PQQ synthesis protein D (PqqD)
MAWKFADEILITPIEPEAVLLNQQSGDNYVLNGLGLAICALIQEGYNETSMIIDRLQQQFPETAPEIPQDVETFLESLRTEGLLHDVDE